MPTYAPPSIDAIPFSESADGRIVPKGGDFLIERHAPNIFHHPYHHHTSVEINLLDEGNMTYEFPTGEVEVASGFITIFWGATPHRVSALSGHGTITNIYLPLSQFTRWGLPNDICSLVMSGAVIRSRCCDPMDASLLDRLHAERDQKSTNWRRLHIAEIENRLRRLALEGWETLLPPTAKGEAASFSFQNVAHVEAMVRFVADNFSVQITNEDVAHAANLSPSRASKLFRQVMGTGIRQQIISTRLSHACMLLTETNAKVASIALDCGFASLSAFYDAFTAAFEVSPAQFRQKTAKGKTGSGLEDVSAEEFRGTPSDFEA